ncbi:hypothetical protein X737_23715 [Mesorhizobium sp. L48C026A00]|nr:hypothetical protein X737_23715 [Mesorhizobium sp. L48C026A00]
MWHILGSLTANAAAHNSALSRISGPLDTNLWLDTNLRDR